ncbi:outer membrane beta-barrel protein [Flavobacterium polysaccharolyticum]|uniref:Outer membrane beta-barrel protein n=1 Tax=Flavobacterium polysaccharolyticum TaxID=3133148 RepID=A0ABU9NUC5_9FLAO
MKKKLLFIILLILTNKSFSQKTKFSAELNYPFLFTHNFIADNYSGIIDLGLKYRFINAKKVNLGISINAGILKTNNEINSVTQNYKITIYELDPKIFAEFNYSKIHPFVGIGYTSMIFKSSTSNINIIPIGQKDGYYRDGFSLNNTQSGLNLNIGLKYDFYKNLFSQIQYNYILLGTKEPIINSRYNSNVNIIKIGIGINF